MSATDASFFQSDFQAESGDRWVAVAAGNSRCLWGEMAGDRLLRWQRCALGQWPEWVVHPTEIWLASVGKDSSIADLVAISNDTHTEILTLERVPLQGTYPTLGLDRALALVGAARQMGWPVLAIDGGTALTFSAADDRGVWSGGAILPGLRLQTQSLHDSTAALPPVDLSFGSSSEAIQQPSRWASSTPEAIRSGIFYSTVAAVRDFGCHWRHRYPDSPIVFTGGDGELLFRAAAFEHSYYDPVLVLAGIASCRDRERERSSSSGSECPSSQY